tara:strand:- start:703 stop:2211 length:1509 start_codon:yes stop_codon:yes gene_type:complete
MKILVTESQFKKLILKEQTTTLYKRGSKGEKVKEIQQILKNNGYDLGTSGPNKDGVDGKYGDKTYKAVRDYQSKNKLKIDGIVGPETLTSMEVDTKHQSNQKTAPIGGRRANLLRNYKNISGDERIVVSPFKNTIEGNKFRQFVNNEYKKIAEKLKLDPKGKHDNKYILTALNYIVDGENLYSIFNRYNNPTYWDYVKDKKDAIERGFAVKDTVPGADRINKELAYIQVRNANNGKPFFIVDPRLNLVLAFTKDYKLIDYSQSVASADKQQDVVFTRAEWCQLSGGEWKAIRLKNKKFIKTCVKGNIVSSNSVASDKPEYTKGKVYNYSILAKKHKRYQAPGIYKINSKYYKKGYRGKKGIPNTLGLGTLDGVDLGTAIHAIVPVKNRLVADAELSKLLKKDLQYGNIPPEYIEAVESMTSKYDLSAGCFNVDPQFIQNPKVQAMANIGTQVFLMSENPKDYLVKVEPGKEGDYFIKLGGVGQDEFCPSPSSLTKEFGVQIT